MRKSKGIKGGGFNLSIAPVAQPGTSAGLVSLDEQPSLWRARKAGERVLPHGGPGFEARPGLHVLAH